MSRFDRRAFVALGAGFAAMAGAAQFALAERAFKDIRDLQPGEFTWHPERSAAGPVAVVVSIPEQRVHVYRNGVRIAVSTCSTGKPGHATPTGVFTVLQKDKHHRSSTYSGAPMPNMNRLTWSGIALHAGNLPGYPASHGCVRLPMDFSEKLFDVTHIGTPVIIAGSHSDPWELVHPGLVLGGYAASEFGDVVDGLKGKQHPADWGDAAAQAVSTLLASSVDGAIVLLENGVEKARGKLTVKGSPRLGEHVLMLDGGHEGARGMVWRGISHHPDPGSPGRPEENIVTRLSADNAFVAAMRAAMHPGMMLIVTDLPTHPDRRSGSDFVVMDAAS